MNNVGGSAGDGGFQFQAKIIAFVSVHILAETAFAGLEQDMEGIPIAVSAETNGPGDDVRIELTQPASIIELQAKKGLRVDTRFDEAIDKIALGLVRDRTSNVILAVNPQTGSRIREKLPQDLHRLRQGRTDAPHDQELLNRVLQLFTNHVTSQNLAYELAKRLFVHTFDVEEANSRDVQTALYILRSHVLLDKKQTQSAWDILVQAGHDLIEHRGRYEATDLVRLLQSRTISLSGSLLLVVKNRYQTWLSENTATFTIPGPSGLSLPIDTAWTKLHVLSKQNRVTRLSILNWIARSRQADKIMLEAILRLISFPSTLIKKRSKLKALTVLLYALHVPDSGITHWDILRRLDDIEAVDAVLLGYIEALQLDKKELARDAIWALTELHKANQQGIAVRSLLSLLPKVPMSEEVLIGDSVDVPVQNLIQALKHPSAIIARGAAQLLTAKSTGKEEIADILLTTNDEELLRIIAEIADPLWRTEARPLFIKRLEQGYGQGISWLIEELPHLPGDHTDQQFQQTLLNALNANDPRIAISAVHALQKLDISLLKNMGSELQSSLLYWQEQGERAKAKSFYMADDCPTCRIEFGNAHAHISQLLNNVNPDYNS